MSEIGETIFIPIEQLYEPYYNPRKHPEKQVYNLSLSLKEFGQRRTISVWPDGKGKYEVLAGNGIKRAAELAKLPGLNCTLAPADWPEIRRKAYSQADNQGGYEDDQLAIANILQEVLNDSQIPLEALGSSQEELDALLESITQAADSDWSDALGDLPDGDKSPFEQMTFTLSNAQAEIVRAALDRAKDDGPFVDTGNENSNGNALARICEVYG